jgi:hypothetical protein
VAVAIQARICLVVPMYALTSWGSFINPASTVYVETSRDVYVHLAAFVGHSCCTEIATIACLALCVSIAFAFAFTCACRYEAFVVYCFLTLVLEYAGGDRCAVLQLPSFSPLCRRDNDPPTLQLHSLILLYVVVHALQHVRSKD